MSKRVAALLAQVAGVVLVAGAVGVWWRPEAGVVVAGLGLVAGGALNESGV